jgi:hypothetical protein
VVGSCQHDDEPSCSAKCGKSLDQLSVLSASPGALCSVKFGSQLSELLLYSSSSL